MKVAINISRETLGGITTSNLNLIKHLYKDDCEVVGIELNNRRYMKSSVLYRRFDPTVFDHNIINIHDYSLKKIVDKSKNLSEVTKQFSEIVNIIVKILKQEQPDVILISGTFYIPWLISLAAKKLKIPTVLWYSGVLTKETESYPEHDRKIYRQMELNIIKNANKIIFPSNICADAVKKHVLKNLKKESYIIPNPVSHDFTDSPALNYSVTKSIAAVGRYVNVKNFNFFFEIHKLLLAQKWTHDCFFITSTERKKIKKLPKTINTLPPMNTEGIKNFYASQGLIICPSLFETFGNVPMEAVCMGVPVLVSNTMGCSEVLKKAGLENMVMSFTDKKEVAKRVRELCGQSILPKEINALRKMLNPDLVHEKIKSILNSCIK